jgi:hypothetical protein
MEGLLTRLGFKRKYRVKRMNVFISHAGADRDIAAQLAEKLRTHNFSVTNAWSDFALGDNLALEMGKALEKSDAMIVLWSPEAAASRWVHHEIGYALGSPKFEGRLIPVVLRPTDNFPWILQSMDVMRASPRSSDLDKVVQRLRSAVRNRSVDASERASRASR